MAIKLNERTLALLAARSSSKYSAHILTLKTAFSARICTEYLNRRRQMLFLLSFTFIPNKNKLIMQYILSGDYYMKEIKLDVHTHTLASGHAYGTINEMIKEASNRNLDILGITEHGPGIPGACNPFYFFNIKVVPRMQYGVKLMLGAEINILDYKGTLDLKHEHIKHLDLRIAGIHFQCYKPGSIDENTTAIINAIKNPDIDIISHPDDGHCPLDYEAVVKAAKEYHTLLELNNNALRSSSRLNVAQNQETLMKLSMKYDVPMICGSDAHYMNDIANYTCIEPIIKKVNFPDKLIINYDTKKFEEYINENAKNRLYQ